MPLLTNISLKRKYLIKTLSYPLPRAVVRNQCRKVTPSISKKYKKRYQSGAVMLVKLPPVALFLCFQLPRFSNVGLVHPVVFVHCPIQIVALPFAAKILQVI